MNRWRLIFRSLLQYASTNFAVLLGVAAATAVLTGALIIGDSVRGSLKDLALSRLGTTHEVLLSERFFRLHLANQLKKQNPGMQVVPVTFLQGTLQAEANDQGGTNIAGNVAVLGIDDKFWELGDVPGWSPTEIADDEIVINQPLAQELAVSVGDQITVRLPGGNDVPGDSPLGRKESETRSLPRLKITAVIPADGLGRFGLHPTQQLPLNAYVSLTAVQQAMEEEDRINAVFFGRDAAAEAAAEANLEELFIALPDFNFRLDHVRESFRSDDTDQEKIIFDWWQLSSDRMIFSHTASDAITHDFGDLAKPVFTYLATSIGVGELPEEEDPLAIPYSTISAVDFASWDFPFLDEAGQPISELANDEIVLNSAAVDIFEQERVWQYRKENDGATEDEARAASQINVGDTIYVKYFKPESAHGTSEETGRTFRLAAITPVTTPLTPFRRQRDPVFDQPPTTSNDPNLTPVVAGITDQASIDDWDPPFPYDNTRMDGEDESYLDNFRTTPKALVSLETGQSLWASRFGNATSFRFSAEKFPDEHALQTRIEEALMPHREALGFRLLKVRQDALRAASGTTPFNVLFLGFSMFIIAAALMLVSLLFRLGLEQRSRQIGLLEAVGLGRQLTQSLLMREAAMVAVAGSILGVLVGIGYAWLMLAGLRTWWLGAVVTPFLELHLDNPSTMVIGLVSGVVVCLITIYFGMRGLKGLSIRGLLAGATSDTQQTFGRQSRIAAIGAGICLVGAIALSMLATTLGGEAQAGAFFGSGALVLTACMLGLWHVLRGGLTSGQAGRFSLTRLSISNAARNPGRSTLTIGLMGAATFLIVAIGSFRLSPSEKGSGGMDLLAESSQPIFHDLDQENGRNEIGFVEAEEALLARSTVLSCRVQPGDDASCLNLYQSNSPRVLGISDGFINYYDQQDVVSFEWAGSAATNEEQKANPWNVLRQPADGVKTPIPVVIDKNTAMYALHLYGGIGEEFSTTDDDGRTTKYVVAGLIANSIFQGNLLIGEENFLKRYPDANGYRLFLIGSPEGQSQQVSQILETRLADQGFDTVDTKRHLASLLAVQNTYLSTFQSLGALGLLLGTFGLAAVQLRTILERKPELALMRAAGFSKSRLQRLVLQETLFLLVGGLATGVVSALVTVVPHMLFGDASIPFGSLAAMLGVILVVGLVSGSLAVRSALKGNIVPALRAS